MMICVARDNHLSPTAFAALPVDEQLMLVAEAKVRAQAAEKAREDAEKARKAAIRAATAKAKKPGRR